MIPVLRPSCDQNTLEELNDVIKSGWWGQGPKTAELEEKFALYTGFKHAVALSSATAALDLCFKVYGLTEGECITSALTFVADASEPERNGLEVVFADIDEKTLCLDIDTLVISDRTKAIIVVHSHGRVADVGAIREKFNGLIIEDCAHCGGMTVEDGIGLGDIQVWSFQAVKTLPAGDGGMITTNNPEIVRKIKNMTWLGVEKSTYQRNQGNKYSWDYDITQTGTKSYMNDINAVLALGQLRRVNKILDKRHAIQERYNKAFQDLPVTLPKWSKTCQYYTLRVKYRDKVSNYLAENGITTSVHFKPLSEMTYWKKAVKRPIPVTDRVWKELLSLPCHDALTEEEQGFVIDKFREAVTGMPVPPRGW